MLKHHERTTVVATVETSGGNQPVTHSVHQSDRGDEAESNHAAPERVPSLPLKSLKRLEEADVFDPGLEPEMVLIPRGANEVEVIFEPEVGPPPRRSTWREDYPKLNNNLPTFTLTLALILVGLALLSTLVFAPRGGTELVAGPRTGTSETVVEADESTTSALASTNRRTSRKDQPADTTGSGRSSEVLDSPTTITSPPTSKQRRRRTTTPAATSKATTTTRRTTTTATTTALPTTTTSTLDPTLPSTSIGSSSQPTTTDTGQGTDSTDSSAPAPQILQFGNTPAVDGGQCPEGRAPYDAGWNTLNTNEVRLTLPGGAVITGPSAGGHQLCGAPGQQLTLQAIGPGGIASASTVLG